MRTTEHLEKDRFAEWRDFVDAGVDDVRLTGLVSLVCAVVGFGVTMAAIAMIWIAGDQRYRDAKLAIDKDEQSLIERERKVDRDSVEFAAKLSGLLEARTTLEEAEATAIGKARRYAEKLRQIMINRFPKEVLNSDGSVLDFLPDDARWRQSVRERFPGSLSPSSVWTIIEDSSRDPGISLRMWAIEFKDLLDELAELQGPSATIELRSVFSEIEATVKKPVYSFELPPLIERIVDLQFVSEKLLAKRWRELSLVDIVPRKRPDPSRLELDNEWRSRDIEKAREILAAERQRLSDRRSEVEKNADLRQGTLQQHATGVVTLVTGVVIQCVSGLFYVRSNRVRKDVLESLQTLGQVESGRQLLADTERIRHQRLRAATQAAILLKQAGSSANVPDLIGAIK